MPIVPKNKKEAKTLTPFLLRQFKEVIMAGSGLQKLPIVCPFVSKIPIENEKINGTIGKIRNF